MTTRRTGTGSLHPDPRTPRRPVDLLAGVVGLVITAAIVLTVRVATEAGQVPGLGILRTLLPSGLLFLIALGANLLIILLVCFVILRTLFVGQLRALIRSGAAGASAYALTSLVNAALVTLLGPGRSPEPLTGVPSDVFTSATLGYVAAAVAFARTMPTGYPRVRPALWAGAVAVTACALLAGITRPVAVVLTVLIGLTCAFLARYGVGSPAPANGNGRVHAELRRFGMTVVHTVRASSDNDGNPRYLAELDNGSRVELALLRSENTAAFWRRLRDLLLLRGPVAPRILYGVRRRAEHTALMSFSARAAGAVVPRVLAVSDLGAGTVLVAREPPNGRPLDTLDEDELTDDLLDLCWNELGLLHRHRVAHGNLNGAVVALWDGGTEWAHRRVAFTGIDRGMVAAPQVRIALDNAAMITLLAVLVGPQRAVASAVRALGMPATAALPPLLQPAGIPYTLRAKLRSDRELLGDLRAHIVERSPEAPAAPARLERMRPRAIASVIVATAVGLVLLYQLPGVDFAAIGQADLAWAVAALVMATVCMVAAAMVLVGFVPMPLPWWRTVMVQYAAAFVRIAAPAGLGSITINSRFVIKAGASTGLALSAVGLTQIVALLVQVPLLLVCAYLAGASYWTGFTPSPAVIVICLAATAVIGAVLLQPRLRRATAERIRPYLSGVLPRLVETLQRPASLALGLGGTLLLTLAFVLCLHFSVLAFLPSGEHVSLFAVAVVFLAGNAIGSAAPTPGGLGAVEAALIGGLTTVVGASASVALPAVLLFRVLTFWLPVLPGWAAFSYLQRKEAV